MRNYSLDFLKGFMALGILFIHTGTFIITSENYTVMDSYLYSLSSLFVPLFFTISGYFFAKSKNKDKATINIATNYVLYYGLILIFNSILLGYHYNTDVLTELLFSEGVNYFWFVNSLMYYMFFFFVIDRIVRLEFDKLFWAILIIGILNLNYYINLDKNNVYQFMDFMYFAAGYAIAKWKYVDQVALPKYVLGFVLLYPFCVGLVYNPSTFYTLLFSVLVFMVFKSMKLNKNFMCFYGKYSLLILFVHYYLVLFLLEIGITGIVGYRYILTFMILLAITLGIVHSVDLSSRTFKKIVNKGKASSKIRSQE